jgi:hypothetical protein
VAGFRLTKNRREPVDSWKIAAVIRSKARDVSSLISMSLSLYIVYPLAPLRVTLGRFRTRFAPSGERAICPVVWGRPNRITCKDKIKVKKRWIL